MAMMIVSDVCTACGDCEPDCPTNAIFPRKGVYAIDAEKCTECRGASTTIRAAWSCAWRTTASSRRNELDGGNRGEDGTAGGHWFRLAVPRPPVRFPRPAFHTILSNLRAQETRPMSDAPLSRELALRIGLAARSLAPIDAATLIGIVVDAVGLPLTAEKLNNLGMKAFRQAGGEALLSVSADDLKAALSYLRGNDLPQDEAAPPIAAYSDGDMPGSLRGRLRLQPGRGPRTAISAPAPGSWSIRSRPTRFA